VSVKKIVGEGVLVGVGVREFVGVGRVAVGDGVHVAGATIRVGEAATVGLSVGVDSSATRVGSCFPKGDNDGAMNTTT
jgi:hypothetical protein